MPTPVGRVPVSRKGRPPLPLLLLLLRADNEAAIKFFERWGFKDRKMHMYLAKPLSANDSRELLLRTETVIEGGEQTAEG